MFINRCCRNLQSISLRNRFLRSSQVRIFAIRIGVNSLHEHLVGELLLQTADLGVVAIPLANAPSWLLTDLPIQFC